MNQADILAERIRNDYPVYNIEKIYLDAWPKIGTSVGQRYPGVNNAINERIRKGALIINYIGHGNEFRLADENIIDVNDVLSWKNRDRLPVFMTATCDFSRFDNPSRVSAGEWLFLNPGGGAIACFQPQGSFMHMRTSCSTRILTVLFLKDIITVMKCGLVML
jgi:hypothetical protein